MMLHWKYSSIDNFENRKFLKSSLSDCKTSGFVIVTHGPALVCDSAKLKSSIFRPLRIMSLIQTTTNWELIGLTTIEFILKELFYLHDYFLPSFSVRAFWESVNSQSDSLSVSIFSSGLKIKLLLFLSDLKNLQLRGRWGNRRICGEYSWHGFPKYRCGDLRKVKSGIKIIITESCDEGLDFVFCKGRILNILPYLSENSSTVAVESLC